MLVAAIQLSSQDAVQSNLERIRALVAEAVRRGARFVALPENFAFMGPEEEKFRVAESLDGQGPILQALREMAMTHNVHVLGGGMPEVSAIRERPFNTSVLIGPDGRIVAKYRKVHLFDVDTADGKQYRESAGTSAGDAVVTADWEGASVGFSICYDVRFPELYRALSAQGARIVCVPAAFTVMTGKDHWHVLLRARAIENQVFVIAPAQNGTHPLGRMTYGKSVIVDPWGDIIAQAGEGEGMAIAALDFAYQDRVRANLPCLQHRKLKDRA